MGNKHAKLGCVSAPRHDGEYPSYNTSIRDLSTTESATSNFTESRSVPHPHSDDDDLSHSHSSHIDGDGSHEAYPYHAVNVKLLFLDVDGVLNNNETKWDEYTNGIDDKLLKYLKLILLKTGCKIVLSTTWRLNEKAKQILLHSMKARADINIDDIVIGQTKSLKHKGKHRTNEIYQYLKENQYRFNVISWCALDDLSLNKYDEKSAKLMNGHFVKTNPKKGLSPTNALNCIDILNANDYQSNPYYYHPYDYQHRYAYFS